MQNCVAKYFLLLRDVKVQILYALLVNERGGSRSRKPSKYEGEPKRAKGRETEREEEGR